jgi:hypothetical protein
MFFRIKNIFYNIYCLKKKDSILKVLINLLGFFPFSIFFRAQVPEIKFLQYVPGFSIFYFLIFFIFLLLLYNTFFFLANNYEEIKLVGEREILILKHYIKMKYIIAFFFLGLNALFLLLLPLTIDSLLSYGEQSLENLWSFYEILILEVFLICFFFIFSQIPSLLNIFSGSQNILNKLQIFWRLIFFFSILFSGIITPTIDYITQLILAFLLIFFYYLTLNILEKKLFIRLSNLVCLNF